MKSNLFGMSANKDTLNIEILEVRLKQIVSISEMNRSFLYFKFVIKKTDHFYTSKTYIFILQRHRQFLDVSIHFDNQGFKGYHIAAPREL